MTEFVIPTCSQQHKQKLPEMSRALQGVTRFPGRRLEMPSGLFLVFVVKWDRKEIN